MRNQFKVIFYHLALDTVQSLSLVFTHTAVLLRQPPLVSHQPAVELVEITSERVGQCCRQH